MRRIVIAASLALSLLPAAARGSEPGWAPAEAFYPPAHSWYGWQLLAVDALSIGAVAWGIDRDRTDAIVAGSVGFALLPPAIHALHGHGGKELLEGTGMRIGAPLTFAYVAGRIAEGACKDSLGSLDEACGTSWLLGGLATGVLTVVVMDALSREPPVTISPAAIRDARGDPAWGLALVARLP